MPPATRVTRGASSGAPLSDDDPLLDTAEAAEFLRVQRSTLAVWRSTGRYALPFVRIGRLVRYRRSALERWRSEREFKSTGEYQAQAKGGTQ